MKFLLLVPFIASVAAAQSLIGLGGRRPSLRLHDALLNRFAPHNALADVKLFESEFQKLVASAGLKVASKYIDDSFVGEMPNGKDTYNKKQYLDYLSKQNLKDYFSNPENAHFGDNGDLYVIHQEDHIRYQFILKPQPILAGKYQLKQIQLEHHQRRLRLPPRRKHQRLAHTALEEVNKFESAFKSLSLNKAAIYIDNNFVYTGFDGKRKNKQQFLDYLSINENVDVYFSNPKNAEFDKQDNLIFNHVEHGTNFRFVARPYPPLAGGYVLTSVTPAAHKRKSLRYRNIESSSSSSEEDILF